jgi:hypothetical protein
MLRRKYQFRVAEYNFVCRYEYIETGYFRLCFPPTVVKEKCIYTGEVQLVSPPLELPETSCAMLYILDANVLIHDPTAIRNFDEHHVIIPITVLEELDKLKPCGNLSILMTETPDNVVLLPVHLNDNKKYSTQLPT